VLPQNINDVDSESLLKAGARNGRQWLVVAGWECQDLSNACSGKGLRGRHSSTFFPLMDVCASLQLLQPELSPAFIFENTSIQTHRDNRIVIDDFNTICSVIGQHVY
jgi:site-specific DNA-cytosine methylase